jgi:hypothetical protein
MAVSSTEPGATPFSEYGTARRFVRERKGVKFGET